MILSFNSSITYIVIPKLNASQSLSPQGIPAWKHIDFSMLFEQNNYADNYAVRLLVAAGIWNPMRLRHWIWAGILQLGRDDLSSFLRSLVVSP
jgi:hypothetical protein